MLPLTSDGPSESCVQKQKPETFRHRWRALLDDEPEKGELTRELKRKVQNREMMRIEVLQSSDSNCFDPVAYTLRCCQTQRSDPIAPLRGGVSGGTGLVYTDEAGQSMEAP